MKNKFKTVKYCYFFLIHNWTNWFKINKILHYQSILQTWCIPFASKNHLTATYRIYTSMLKIVPLVLRIYYASFVKCFDIAVFCSFWISPVNCKSKKKITIFFTVLNLFFQTSASDGSLGALIFIVTTVDVKSLYGSSKILSGTSSLVVHCVFIYGPSDYLRH